MGLVETLKMEIVGYSETVGPAYQITRRHIAEATTLLNPTPGKFVTTVNFFYVKMFPQHLCIGIQFFITTFLTFSTHAIPVFPHQSEGLQHASQKHKTRFCSQFTPNIGTRHQYVLNGCVINTINVIKIKDADEKC
jgi:hypothetical protein